MKLKKKISFVIAMILLSFSFYAQEGTRPMSANLNYLFPELDQRVVKPNVSAAAKTNTGSITLPFFDDFYYASFSSYPNQNLWADSSAYINTGMPRAPLTLGVATFDGLNKKGFPYTPDLAVNSSTAFAADTLTSRPINLFTFGTQTLQPTDSVALIFYYQMTGNGDSPEVQDSLMVDFYKPAQAAWNKRQWALRGNTVLNNNDTVFKRVFIWITDTAFFHDGFKFRFRNKAATNGNFDNWHIDYVYLDKNRSILADTVWNDLTIGYVPTPFLKNYSSMPWHQFTDVDMATKYSNYIRYNGTTTVNTTYQYQMYNSSNALVNSNNYGAANLAPFKTGGWQHNTVHSNPNLSYTFAPMTDSTDFTIKHSMLNLAGDINIGNDTVFQKQQFRNYYAYDDGSCETGYYILGTGGLMAQKYKLNFADTLRSVRIYFDPVGSITYAQGNYKMKINVYADGGSGPGAKIFTSDSIYPVYSTSGHNRFREYKFNSPLQLSSGNYYIGIQQFVASGITIGFDKNYDSSTNLYYDSGNGWTQSSIKGSLMLRPVFGRKIDPPVSVKENSLNDQNVFVYPNPTNNELNIKVNTAKADFSCALYSISGSFVLKQKLEDGAATIQTESLANGVYILMISSPTQGNCHQKVIIQH